MPRGADTDSAAADEEAAPWVVRGDAAVDSFAERVGEERSMTANRTRVVAKTTKFVYLCNCRNHPYSSVYVYTLCSRMCTLRPLTRVLTHVFTRGGSVFPT